MASQEEIKEVRLAKLQKLESLGIEAYPISVRKDYDFVDLRQKFDELEPAAKEIAVTGRIMSLRGQGGLIFCDLFDGTGMFQAIIKKDEPLVYIQSAQDGEKVTGLDETIAHPNVADAFDLFQETADIGDFLEVRGMLMRTKRGEMSISASAWRIITKSMRALPEKWAGLQDVEERYRRRYLDVLTNEEVRNSFILRTKTVSLIRRFFDDHGYLEVELPILQALAGGATAAVFKTHHNALDLDFNLTIAQELFLKKLVVGGFNKVYEMGRRFRNEGIDVTHNPEFTMLESQEVYADAKSQRQFIQELVQFLVKEIFGKDSFEYNGNTIDVSKPFEVKPFLELISETIGVQNLREYSREDLVALAEKHGADIEAADEFEKIVDKIYKKAIRPNLIQPVFLINYPVEFNPFAKRREDDKMLIDRFQLVMGGLEVTNCFSELNNPVDQKLRYEEQDRKKRKGDGEISPSDLDYLEAMEYGMPPNGGIGIGIDRIIMLFMNTKNIKDAILFPTMRPEDGSAANAAGNSSAGAAKLAKENRYAAVILNGGADMQQWQKLNTVGHLTAAFGHRTDQKLFYQDKIHTADEQEIFLNIKHAIMIKEAKSNAEMKKIIHAALLAGLEVAEFTREMIETTNDKKVIEATKQKGFAEVEHLGVLVFGPKSKVDEVTEGTELAG